MMAGRVRKKRRHRLRGFLIGMLICILVPVLVLAGVAAYLQHRLASQIDRVDDVFAHLPNRPTKDTGFGSRPLDILFMGTDRRSDTQTTGESATAPAWKAGAQRSDTMMVVHIAADRRSISVISIPRDTWVVIPGHGVAKINAALSWGGPSLAVETVENVTGVRIDHVAMIDWKGFAELTDSIGGVTIDIPKTVKDPSNHVTWHQGRQKLSGDQSLLYVRQRYGLPGGDFDRIHRQENFLRSLFDQVLEQELIREPRKLYNILDLITQNLTVDSDWSVGQMRSLMMSLRNLRSADISYLTIPTRGTGMEGDQSVVYFDQRRNQRLWAAVREDQVPIWLAANPTNALPDSVR